MNSSSTHVYTVHTHIRICIYTHTNIHTRIRVLRERVCGCVCMYAWKNFRQTSLMNSKVRLMSRIEIYL